MRACALHCVQWCARARSVRVCARMRCGRRGGTRSHPLGLTQMHNSATHLAVLGSLVEVRSPDEYLAEYKVASRQWSNSAHPLIASLVDVMVAVRPQQVWVLGSCDMDADDNPANRNVWMFTSASGWQRAPSLVDARVFTTAAALDGVIYAIGGRSHVSVQRHVRTLHSCEMIDTTEARPAWSSIAPLPVPLQHAGAAAVAGCVYVAGGGSIPANGGICRTSCRMFRYEIAANRWHEVASMQHNRGSLALAAVNGFLYAISDDHPIECYDTTTDRWSSTAIQLLPPQAGASRRIRGAAACGSRIYITVHRSSEIQVLETQPRQWLHTIRIAPVHNPKIASY